MRSTLTILVALLAGCAPVPPGDVVGGHAEWADESAEYSGDVALCFADPGTIRITAGERGESLLLVLSGDWAQPEWDATDVDGAYGIQDAAGLLLLPFYACTAHVGTGAGEWIVDLECADPALSAHVVVTGCERR